MLYSIKRRIELTPVPWTGGTTTELFIHPNDANNTARNFVIRISSATVELEESTFSDFSGYRRHITPLAGTMRLEHAGHHSVTLHPYETDSFDGNWTTRSFGKCVDFNLIHRPDWKGSIRGIAGSADLIPHGAGYMGIYVLKDTVTATVFQGGDTTEETLDAGDFLCFESMAPSEFFCHLTCQTGDGECFAVAALVFR